MQELIIILNNVTVGIFGCVLSAAFCGMGNTAKSRWKIAALTVGILAIQGCVILSGYGDKIRNFYPLLIHFPLIVVLCCMTKRKLWACTSVFLAYLCCQLRRWFALLLLSIVHGSRIELAIFEIVLTIPILYLLLKFVAPTASRLKDRPVTVQLQFCLIPVLYYVYDYMTIVYTDWLYSGKPAVVEFMPFVCCAAYLAFLLRISEENQRRNDAENDRNNLNIQVTQSIRELASLRTSQNLAATYRHDMRHHLQYLSACIENGEYVQAQSYIQNIYTEIEAQKVVPYCENEAVNLILSAYVGRAKKDGIKLNIQVVLAPIIGISANDLCVLLSNALENALKACMRFPKDTAGQEIDIQSYEKNGKLFLQIINPCAETVEFENGLPMTREAGHGMGTRSIQAIVKRYNGLCSFAAENGQFILRVSI